MKDSTITLKEFIDSAQRSRKYPDNTAAALRVALRLFESELNDEEKTSVEKLRDNLDSIYHSVYEKNKTKYSAGSLDAYRKRVSKLIKDYLNYGTDPAKMNSWSPPVRRPSVSRRSRSTNAPGTNKQEKDESSDELATVATPGTTRIDWPLSGEGRKAVLVLPLDLSKDEAETIKKLIGLRVADSEEGGN